MGCVNGDRDLFFNDGRKEFEKQLFNFFHTCPDEEEDEESSSCDGDNKDDKDKNGDDNVVGRLSKNPFLEGTIQRNHTTNIVSLQQPQLEKPRKKSAQERFNELE